MTVAAVLLWLAPHPRTRLTWEFGRKGKLGPRTEIQPVLTANSRCLRAQHEAVMAVGSSRHGGRVWACDTFVLFHVGLG